MEGFRFEAEDEDGAGGGTGKEEEETSSAGEVARHVHQGWKSLLERVWAKIPKLLLSREKTVVCRPLASPVGHGQSQIAVVNVPMEQHFIVTKCCK